MMRSMKIRMKQQRIGACMAPVLLLAFALILFTSHADAEGVIPMFTGGPGAWEIRGGIRFDMLPDEAEAVERDNGLAPFQVLRAFTLSWNRLEYTGMEGASLVYRFEDTDGLRLQEILWSLDADTDADAVFEANCEALSRLFGAQPTEKRLPCPTKTLSAFGQRLFAKQGAEVYASREWLIRVDEGEAVVDLYLCRDVQGKVQLRLGLMLLTDPEAAENHAFLSGLESD